MLRAVIRLAAFLAAGVWALCGYALVGWMMGRAKSLAWRCEWASRLAKRLLSILGVEVRSEGPKPASGLLVANHLGYLDIVVLFAVRPMVFVSKADVRTWPLLGVLTRCAGTLFIRRERRGDVGRLVNEMAVPVDAGLVLTVFPEGTSSGGTDVLPFYSSLLEPAVQRNWPVTPAWISYELELDDGIVEQEVAYWGEMTFGPHLVNLAGKKRIRARVVFGEAESVAGADRKALATRLRARVRALGGLPDESR